jgi:SagB-type dehydrogenase family enzyme
VDTHAPVADLAGQAEEPAFPRLCEGLLVLPLDDGLLFEGGPRRKLVRGGGAPALSALLPLLDGQHAVPAVAAELGWKVSDVRTAVSVLDASGLVEHGMPDAVSSNSSAPSHVLAFLSRQISVTRRHPNARSAAGALAKASVLLIAPERIAEPIQEALAGAAVGHLVWRADPRAVGEREMRAVDAAGQPAVTVMHDDAVTTDAFGVMERRCRTHGMPLLRFAASPGKIEIGPLFYKDFTACYACFSRGCQELDWTEVVPTNGSQAQNEDNADLAAGLVSQEILALVSQITWPTSYRALTVLPTATLLQRGFAVTPYPDCVACGSRLPPAADPAGELAAAYEWTIQDPPAELWPAAESDNSRGPAIPGLETQRPDFPTCPRRPLPPPEKIPPPLGRPGGGQGQQAIRPDGRLSETIIAGMLLYAAGRRGQDGGADSSRWAPSAGNLGSAEIYALCVPGQFRNLPGTIFRYDDLSHEMIALRSDCPGLDECLAGTPLANNMPLMALVLVGAIGRIRQKYGPSGYRLAHLDAGCAVFQLAAVAESYGLRVSFTGPAGQALANLLELYPEHEEITAIAGIYPPGRRDATD